VAIEERVLLLLLDGPEFAISSFGAIKIGGRSRPSQYFAQARDYQYILNNSAARWRLSVNALSSRFSHFPGTAPLLCKHIIVVGAEACGALFVLAS